MSVLRERLWNSIFGAWPKAEMGTRFDWQRRNLGERDLVVRGIGICLVLPLVIYQYSPRWAALSLIPLGAVLAVQLRRGWRTLWQRKPPQT